MKTIVMNNGYPLRRPKAPVSFDKIWTSDNMYTRTKIETEYYSGDCMKVIGEMIHQLMFIDKFQKAEVMSLIKCYMDEHIVEYDVED